MEVKKPKSWFPILIAVILTVIAGSLVVKHFILNEAATQTIPTKMDWLDSIKKETINRTVQAKQLIQPHFPEHDIIIINAHPAPGGALIVNATIDGKERSFVVLADNKNFIEGVLNSPYLDNSSVRPSHTKLTRQQAALNSSETAKFRALKNDFASQNSIETIQENKPQTHMKKTQIQEAFVMPEVSTSTQQATKRDLLEKTKLLSSVVFGNKDAPNVYVYFDFNCSACLQAHKTLDRLTKEGLIKVSYIPVGIIDNESIVKTAYTLIPTENTKRQVVFNHMKQQKSIELLLPNKANESELKSGLVRTLENKNVFVELPNPATPTFLYEHNGVSYISIVKSTGDIKKIVRLLNNK